MASRERRLNQPSLTRRDLGFSAYRAVNDTAKIIRSLRDTIPNTCGYGCSVFTVMLIGPGCAWLGSWTGVFLKLLVKRFISKGTITRVSRIGENASSLSETEGAKYSFNIARTASFSFAAKYRCTRRINRIINMITILFLFLMKKPGVAIKFREKGFVAKV